MVKKLLLFLVPLVVIAFVGSCFAEPLSPAMCKQKVTEAAKLISAEGRAAFDKIRDPNGPFRFGDGKEGYIWIHNLDGLMVVHPTKPGLEGTPTIDLQDSRGFKFIRAMNKLVSDYSEGWVVYLWPKPGATTESPKISFVKMAVIGDLPYVVGCGMYDVTASTIKEDYPYDKLVTFEDSK